MATPRSLSRPPIREALIDFACVASQPQEAFEAFGQALASDFPKREIQQGFKSELRIENGKVVPPTMEAMGFQGIMLSNEDVSLRVQFRPTGFTLNNLRNYVGGDRLVDTALGLWSRFAAEFGVRVVTRVAFRYINRLDLPFRPGDDFRRFLVSPPDMPEGAPQLVSEFLTRVVAHDVERAATAIVTQSLKHDPSPVVLVDVDVFRQGEFSAAGNDLRTVIEPLRVFKNEVFFSLLTEEAVGLYV